MARILRRSVVWGWLPDGAPLAFPLIEAEGERAGPTALFTGGIHGDEFEGPLALLDLARVLEGAELRGRVRIVPFANAPALAAGTRTGPLDGVNLARVFPGDAGGGPSARLAAALWALVAEADLLVDSHSGGTDLAFLPVAGFYEAGGGVGAEAAASSRAVAEQTGLADLWALPATPGVLSLEAARAGVTVAGCEVGGRGRARPSDVRLYRDAYLRVLAARGMVGPEGLGDVPAARPARLLRGDWVASPAAGLWRALRPLGAAVRRGEALARVESPLGEVLAVLEAPVDGVILAERNLARVREGDLGLLVATAEDLP